MRIVLQRVSSAEVRVNQQVIGKIGLGYMLLVGIEAKDQQEDCEWLARKIVSLRIFSDDNGKMNLDIKSCAGDILAVSQFTLHAKYKKGSRPSFIRAAHPDHAIQIFANFCKAISLELGKTIQTGEFGAMMEVSLCNAGPTTLILDSQNKE